MRIPASIRPLLLLLLLCPLAAAVVIDEEAVIEGDHLTVTVDPAAGGALTQFALKSAPGGFAGETGLLQEGFGVGSRYVPNRRQNARLEADESYSSRPVLRYSYDCDGPNIAGLHVERVMEFFPAEASVRVTWSIENRGDEAQWVVPWVRFDTAAGGTTEARDRFDIPAREGIVNPEASAYYIAARNWAAVTDPIEEQSLCVNFDADKIYAYLAMHEEAAADRGIQAVFVPVLLEAGATWRTVYRIGAYRGLQRVDFASDEVAVELRQEPGQLVALLSASRALPTSEFHARVVAANGRVWSLPPKQVTLSPGAGMRCTYDWSPIGDGVYEFLGQFRRSDAPVDLGSDTHPPHGGIDTRFVVGKAEAPFEAWSNAPVALQRGARILDQRIAARTDALECWYAPAIEKVFQTDRVAESAVADPTARLSLARNEYESIQLVIRPKEAPLRGMRVEMGPLVHENGEARIEGADTDVLSVLYHEVRLPSYFEGPTGWWPDALPPHTPADAAPGEATPIWLRVHADADSPAGRYTGALRILAEDMDPVELQLEVRVYDFSLPETPALKTSFGYWSEAAQRGAKTFGATPTASALDAAYFENALAHRVTLRDLATFPRESADYPAALAAFAPRMKSMLARGATTFAVPSSLLDFPDQLAIANAFAADQEITDRVYAPIADEPEEPAWPRVLETVQRWQEAAPDIPALVTTAGLKPLIHDGIGILGVHSPVFDTPRGGDLLGRVQRGGALWWYVNDAPPRPYANLLLDFSALEHRVFFWQAWALGISGVQYWSINYSPEGRDPWRDPLDATPVNGDGLLVYPGPAGPVDSIRWECVRDGIEDYDYLVRFAALRDALTAQGGQRALLDAAERAGDLGEILPDLVSFTRDSRVLLNKREALAAMIVAMERALIQ